MSWRRFFRRQQWDAERARELESYIAIETDDNIARGMSPEEARAAAQRKLGNQTRVREEVYRMNSVDVLDTLARDVRYGIRTLRRSPAFTIVALLTLTLGIGTTTTAFSVVNSVLLEPLPYPAPQRLVSVANRAPGAPGLADVSGALRLSQSMAVTYAEHNRVFEHIGIWFANPAAVTGQGEPEQVRTVVVNEGVLEALAVRPIAGRWLSHDDQAPNAMATAMLSYGYWQRRYGGDRSVVGRLITVDAIRRQIVGVMPRAFKVADIESDLILPMRIDRAALIRPGFGFQSVARLRPGVTLAQANADVDRMYALWLNGWPGGAGYERWRITGYVQPLKDAIVGSVGSVMWVVLGTVAIVLLIACANVAGLVLVRADARQQEAAVRAALGAGSWRLVRERLLESIALALVGGLVAVFASRPALRLFVAVAPASVPRLDEIALTARSVMVAVAISIVTGIVIGLVPSFRLPRLRVAAYLRGSARTAGQTRHSHRMQHALVVAEIALALVLLVAAGLMIRTFQALRTVRPGIASPEQVQTVRLAIPPSTIADNARVIRIEHDVADAIRRIPGVTAAGFASKVAMDGLGANWDSVFPADRPYVANEQAPMRRFIYVSPGALSTAGTRLLAGRDLTWDEVENARPVLLISSNLAREFWGSATNAIGKGLTVFGPTSAPWTIVGVAEDVYDNGVDAPAPAIVYYPALVTGPRGQFLNTRGATFVVRSTQAGSATLLAEIQQAIWSVNRDLPVGAARTLQELYGRSLARTTLTLAMLVMAGSMALALGIMGIYGVISYTVTQRRREIGVRMALGEQASEIRQRFVRQGLMLTVVGIACGAVAALAVSRIMTTLLYDVSPLDPITYVVMALVLAISATLASYVPARRASNVSPVEALAAE